MVGAVVPAVKGAELGNWAELENETKLNRWIVETLREVCRHVREEDERRRTSVQQVVAKSTDCLRRMIVPVHGHGGVTLTHRSTCAGSLFEGLVCAGEVTVPLRCQTAVTMSGTEYVRARVVGATLCPCFTMLQCGTSIKQTMPSFLFTGSRAALTKSLALHDTQLCVCDFLP